MTAARPSQGVSELVSSPLPCWEGPILPTESPRPPACPVECPGCPDSETASGPGPIAGWSLAGTAVLTFLVPLMFAVAGAAILRTSSAGQLLGGIAGLTVGMVIVRMLVPALLGREGRPE